MGNYRITTPYGDYYDIYGVEVCGSSNGFKKIPGVSNGHQWDITGVVSFHNNGYIRERLTLDQLHDLYIKNGSSVFRYKNGSIKYAICDIDHGTPRIHGNIKYHGVSHISTL